MIARFTTTPTLTSYWLRAQNCELDNSLFYLMIDKGQLKRVLDYIEGC